MLGMYVHTHWGYRRPYAARTWTLADWDGFLDGLAKLGYDMVMVWPLFDCMPAEPTPSDRDYLATLARAIDRAQVAHGMRVALVSCPNTIGNAEAARYTYQERPYFVCEQKVNPKSAVEVEAFLAGRRRQFAAVAHADALAIIDSDPGGYIGSTRDEFVSLVKGQVEAFRSFNPKAEFIYWMLAGWENYNRFWAKAVANPDAAAHMWSDWTADEFPETLALMQRDIPEPWSALSLRAEHDQALTSLSLDAKNMWFPYGVIEGEPVFPLMRSVPESVAGYLTAERLQQHSRGVMANAQTHCLQLPHIYLFAHIARGGTLQTADFGAFAERLLPGLSEPIVAAWGALDSQDPDRQRRCAAAIRLATPPSPRVGDLAGLLFGSATRFLDDLCANLELRATLVDLNRAVAAGTAVPAAIGQALARLRAYGARTGFVDAYGGPLYTELNEALAKLHDPGLDHVLQDFHRWGDPRLRNGIFPRLLDAMDAYCRGA
jgi:hypothetical protein